MIAYHGGKNQWKSCACGKLCILEIVSEGNVIFITNTLDTFCDYTETAGWTLSLRLINIMIWKLINVNETLSIATSFWPAKLLARMALCPSRKQSGNIGSAAGIVHRGCWKKSCRWFISCLAGSITGDFPSHGECLLLRKAVYDVVESCIARWFAVFWNG